jgi:predicted enzyme related to lactoylglutathione lyase
MITHVKHTVVPIVDQDRALKFYTEKLGFKLVVDAPFEGCPMRWIELKTPEGDTCVVLFTNDEQKDMIGRFSNIVFTCQDVSKTTDQLKAKGVEIVEGPVEAPWGIYSIFKDSEGNRFCLSST